MDRNSQHTRRFDIIVACRLSRTVEFIVDLGALEEIGMALAQSGAHAWLRLGRNTDILF